MSGTLKHRNERSTLALTMSIGGLWGAIAVAINLLTLNLSTFALPTHESPVWLVINFPTDLSSALIFLPLSLIQPLYIPGYYLGTWHIGAVCILTITIGLVIGWAIGKLYLTIRD